MKPLTQLGGLISRRSVFKLPAGAAMLGAGAHFGFVASAKAEGVAA